MRQIAAYRLEKHLDPQDDVARSEEMLAIRCVIDKWLAEKGVDARQLGGKYQPVDQSDGTYRIELQHDGDRSWWMVSLVEVNSEGRSFVAKLSLTNSLEILTVYCTLEIGAVDTSIAPLRNDTRTPAVIRSLLSLGGAWYHGRYQYMPYRAYSSFDQGVTLSDEVRDPARTIPIVIISSDVDGPAISGLEAALKYDLCGLANIVTVDSEASWGITDTLGMPFRCHGGAVRIYWPRFREDDDPLRHQFWSSSKLRSTVFSDEDTLKWFRGQLRRLLMSASATSVIRPQDIDHIRLASQRKEIESLKQSAASLDDYAAIAEMIDVDCKKLQKALDARNEELIQAKDQCSYWQQRAYNAEDQLRYKSQGTSEELIPDVIESPEGSSSPPDIGEVRYYKKRYAARSHDILVQVSDCGCNNWESANKADKAKKGIAKLEGGRQDWKKLWHCASCDGGGMWKVQW